MPLSGMIVNAPQEFFSPALESGKDAPANESAEPGAEFAELLFLVLALPQMASSLETTTGSEGASVENAPSTAPESTPAILSATPEAQPGGQSEGATCADRPFADAKMGVSHALLSLDSMLRRDRLSDIAQLDLGLEEFSEAAASLQSSTIQIGQEAPIDSLRAKAETADVAIDEDGLRLATAKQPKSRERSVQNNGADTAAEAVQSRMTEGSPTPVSAPVLMELGSAGDFAHPPPAARQGILASPFARAVTPPVRDGAKPFSEQDSELIIAVADGAAEPMVERERALRLARNVDPSREQGRLPGRVNHEVRSAASEKMVEPTAMTFTAEYQDGKKLMATSEWQNQLEPSSREETAHSANALGRLDDARGKQSGQREAFLDADGNSQAGSERSPQRNERVMDAPIVFDVSGARRDQIAPSAEAPAITWRPLVDRLAGEIVSHLRVGRQEAVLRLDPPELGKIKIDLRIEDGKLHARIVAEGHESKALLETHLPELRQALLAGQVDVADVRVSQSGWQTGSHDFAQGFQQSQQGRQEAGRNFDPSLANSRLAAETQSQDPKSRERGRVSMWA